MTTNGQFPEPDLASSARAANRVRLLTAAAELEVLDDVAAGKIVAPDVPRAMEWLRPLAAPHYGADPGQVLVRWSTLFADDIETVWRARNNVYYSEPITDGNLAAAADIAERLVQLARDAAPAS